MRDDFKVYCECVQFTDDEGHTGNLPVYKTKLAACADVSIPYDIVIPAKSAVKFDLLIGFNIHDDMKIIMYPRSSLLINKGLVQPTSIIDADYSGKHVHVPFYNPTDHDIVLERGERVAQIECVPRYDCRDWVHETNERTGGFGSTGK